MRSFEFKIYLTLVFFLNLFITIKLQLSLKLNVVLNFCLIRLTAKFTTKPQKTVDY